MAATHDANRHRFSAFVLAGGQSLRMGRDKALVELDGQSLIQRSVGLLRQLTSQVFVIGPPATYSFLGTDKVIPDCVPRAGPLGGIYTALRHSGTAINLILACDMPRMSAMFLNLLIQSIPGFDAVLMRHDDGKLEPLCAAYTKACLPAIERDLRSKKLKVSSFLDQVRVKFIRESDLPALGLDGGIFQNVNTPADLEAEMERRGSNGF
ncbi:MAG: molybdenum cofactor guanylyltransferase [Acidobacteriota bacterium]